MKIEFGTDGWRGEIGKDYNFQNIEKIGYAILNFLNKNKDLPNYKKEIVIGYDTRFLGKETAFFLSEIFSNGGYKVILSDSPVPTPVLSYAVLYFRLPIGIMITASHNPAIYNGIKIKGWYGGSAFPEIYEGIKKCLIEKKIKSEKKGEVAIKDLKKIYIDYLKNSLDLNFIENLKIKILWDSMHGTTGEVLKRIFKEIKCKIKILNFYPDPYFGGVQPEPIPRNLKNTINYLRKNKYEIAGASDGDGDRIGLITKEGEYLWTQKILPILILNHLKNKNEKRGIAKTFSSTSYLDKIGKKYKLKVYETKIGFKYLCKFLLDNKVFIAGEESGGIAFSNFLPERDAIFSFLKILEILKEKDLQSYLDSLYEEFGQLFYERMDMRFDLKKANSFIYGFLKNPPEKILNFKIRKIKSLDGIKLYFENGGWLLLRVSGTENLLRVYCEMENSENIYDIFEYIKKNVRNI